MPRRSALAIAAAVALGLSACAPSDRADLAPSASSAPSSQAGAPPAPAQTGADAELGTSERGGLPLDQGFEGLPRGVGASVDDVVREGALATWSSAPVEFALSVPADPECWPAARQPTADAEGTVVVALEHAEPCAPGARVRTFLLPVPEGADRADGLTIEVLSDEGDVRLELPAP